MNDTLKYYNDNVPEEILQKVIKEQATIIAKIKSDSLLSEEQYIQEFIHDHKDISVNDMTLWVEIIQEAFYYGRYYYTK